MKIVFRKVGTYLMKTLKLYNGIELPAIGFGTYLSTDGNGISAIQSALECGYRYFDTASFYQNEEELGRRRVLEDDICVKMAEKYNCSVANFLLTFLLQQDIMVLPKASAKERIADNLSSGNFKIMDEDMKFLLSLPQIGWSGEHPDL